LLSKTLAKQKRRIGARGSLLSKITKRNREINLLSKIPAKLKNLLSKLLSNCSAKVLFEQNFAQQIVIFVYLLSKITKIAIC